MFTKSCFRGGECDYKDNALGRSASNDGCKFGDGWRARVQGPS